MAVICLDFSKLKSLADNIDNHKPLVVVGDFNIDICNGKNHSSLTQISQVLQCKQLVTEVTNNHGSLIDMVFSNCSDAATSTIESTWSDHKILLTTVPKNMKVTPMIST